MANKTVLTMLILLISLQGWQMRRFVPAARTLVDMTPVFSDAEKSPTSLVELGTKLNNSFQERTLSAITWERERTDCQSIRKIFEQYEYSKLHECAIRCIQFFANSTFSIESLIPEAVENPPHCFAYYRGCLSNFLKDVTANQTQLVGTAIAKTEDLVEFPMALVKQLNDNDVPLLAHAIDKQFQDEVILIPDFHFIQHKGFLELTNTLQTVGRPLRERLETVYWRGSSTGRNCLTAPTIDWKNTSILRDPCTGCRGLQRVALAQIAQNIPFLDIALSNPVQYCKESDLKDLFPSFNKTAQKNNENDWILARGVLDIDGNANAWGARWRLESGSVVFKVESNITNAYLSRLKPYVHYVPIFANLSNLVSQSQLVVGDSALPFLERMVQNANQLMAEFTYEKEVVRVRNELHELWGRPPKNTVVS